jgi:ribosomal protein S13
VDNDKLYSAKYKYDTKPISSDAVIIFKNRYQEGLNLFPFIIDFNSLTDELEVKICFYTYFEEGKRRVTYSDISKISSDKNSSLKDISDPSLVSITYNDEIENDMKANTDNDITRLKKDIKKYNDLRLNTLYKIYQNAKEEILK